MIVKEILIRERNRKMNGKIVLIDGHSIIHRAFYALPDLTNSEGIHTNAVYGFLMIFFKIIEEEKPDYLAVAFDVHAPTFRHEIYADYKGTRKPMPEELRSQVPLLKDVLSAMGITMVEKAGLEADDILGTIASHMEREGLDVSVVSGDRDLLQLATDKIMIRIPLTKQGRTEVLNYHAEDVLAQYHITPSQVVDLKSLMGDASDNIPGVPGIGEKTAGKILADYGTLENAYDHIDEIRPPKAQNAMKEHRDLAEMSKVLATINKNGDFDFRLEDTRLGNIYTQQAYEWYKKLGFKNMLSRFDDADKISSPEDSFQICRSRAEAEDYFAKAASCGRFGFSLLGDGGECLGVSLSFDETTAAILAAGDVDSAYLTSQLDSLLLKSEAAYTCSLKDALHYLSLTSADHLNDMLIAAYLINPLKSDYDYDDIANEYLGITVPDRNEIAGKQTNAELFRDSERDFARYGSYIAYTALRSGDVLLEKLRAEGMDTLYRQIEMPLVTVLCDMEKTGVRVAADELTAYGRQLGEEISGLEEKIYEEAGESFNINSPKQLGQILFEKMKMPYGKKTKTGYSTAADVLEKLAPDYPFVAGILDYRKLMKLKSTYADGLLPYIGPDGRIHGTLNQMITATGRISSTEPNLQNIPIRMEQGREIRKAFIPKDGCIFVDADYSQIELRILASLSGDENLIQAYKEAKDIHRITASQVFHTPFNEVTDLQRRNAKAVNFGIVYGISSFGLSQGLSISRKEAETYIASYFETYPGVKKFLDNTVADAKKNGYMTTYFGRRRPIPELSSGNFMQRSFGERVAMNSPIQGTAADIMKIAMIRVHDTLCASHMRSRIVLQIHDELLIETYPEEKEQVKTILADAMTHAADLSVPLEIDIQEGPNWLEAK